jgi:hypothetical protein
MTKAASQRCPEEKHRHDNCWAARDDAVVIGGVARGYTATQRMAVELLQRSLSSGTHPTLRPKAPVASRRAPVAKPLS